MQKCDLETSVPDWVIEHPETLAVFRTLGIDYSCGGKSLRYACGERGLRGESVMTELAACLKRSTHEQSDEQQSDGKKPD